MALPTVTVTRAQARQIWALPTMTTSVISRHCTPFRLPSRGVLNYDGSSFLTFTENAIFIPECTQQPSPVTNGTLGDSLSRDPFYASTSPQIYAIAAATIISYMLVIMLLITPRTFFIGGGGDGGGFLGRRGIVNGTGGNTSVIGVGSRPWLQKIAAITVAISLTIATVDTFRVAQDQYDHGYEDALALTEEVVGGLELRVIRVISDTFLWLAQVQTLVRLFPRHKEKAMIKWVGFGLITLDTIFSILNGFVSKSSGNRPRSDRSFEDAIPALSYLFELALSLFYAACVIYYSLDKRRFAFLHRNMPNICLVALISLIAILIPVVFFVLDISKPDVAGWGDYVRWVGQAAASVVVWEWVERIEALEREERKEGILGREVFDEDEIRDVTSATEVDRISSRSHRGNGGNGGASRGGPRPSVLARMTRRLAKPRGLTHASPFSLRRHLPNRAASTHAAINQESLHIQEASPQQPIIPLPVASPISRNETTSAASTLYAVRYHTISASTTPGPDMAQNSPSSRSDAPGAFPPHDTRTTNPPIAEDPIENIREDPPVQREPEVEANEDAQRDTNVAPSPMPLSSCEQARIWPSIEYFARSTPSGLRPQRSQQVETHSSFSPSNPPNVSRRVPNMAQLEIISRAKSAMGKLQPTKKPKEPSVPLPNYYIPAQPRRRVWNPERGLTVPLGALEEGNVAPDVSHDREVQG